MCDLYVNINHVMKRFLILFLSVICCDASIAVTYSVDTTLGSFDYSEIIINGGVTISPEYGNPILISTGETVHLYNSGIINGAIDVNGNTLVVSNSGIINGVINPNGGLVKQLITSSSEITHIDMPVGQKPVVVIENYNNFDFNNVQSISAQSFVIRESSIVIDNFSDWQMCSENIELSENISLIINDATSIKSGEVIKYTQSGTTIVVKIPNLDRMYKPELKVSNGGIVLNIVRETDYHAIFDDSNSEEDKRNAALETIRENKPNDKLLKALDAANNIDEMRKLENLSYRFNHGILLRPVKMITKFSLTDLIKSENDSWVGIIPYYIMSDKMDTVGARIYAGYKYDNLYFHAGVNLNKFEYGDKLNDFSGWTYGFDIQSKQIFDKLWFSEILGLSLTDFKADYISIDGKVENNPLSLSWYGDVSAGYDFEIDKEIMLTPIIGFSYQPYKVADVTETDSYAHVGGDVKYFFVVDGVKYEYSAMAAYGTNGDVMADFKVGFTSVTDEAGVSLNVGILKDDFDYYYKISLNAKVLF